MSNNDFAYLTDDIDMSPWLGQLAQASLSSTTSHQLIDQPLPTLSSGYAPSSMPSTSGQALRPSSVHNIVSSHQSQQWQQQQQQQAGYPTATRPLRSLPRPRTTPHISSPPANFQLDRQQDQNTDITHSPSLQCHPHSRATPSKNPAGNCQLQPATIPLPAQHSLHPATIPAIPNPVVNPQSQPSPVQETTLAQFVSHNQAASLKRKPRSKPMKVLTEEEKAMHECMGQLQFPTAPSSTASPTEQPASQGIKRKRDRSATPLSGLTSDRSSTGSSTQGRKKIRAEQPAMHTSTPHEPLAAAKSVEEIYMRRQLMATTLQQILSPNPLQCDMLLTGFDLTQHNTDRKKDYFYIGNTKIAKEEPEGGSESFLLSLRENIPWQISRTQIIFGYSLYQRIHFKEDYSKTHGGLRQVFLAYGSENGQRVIYGLTEGNCDAPKGSGTSGASLPGYMPDVREVQQPTSSSSYKPSLTKRFSAKELQATSSQEAYLSRHFPDIRPAEVQQPTPSSSNEASPPLREQRPTLDKGKQRADQFTNASPPSSWIGKSLT